MTNEPTLTDAQLRARTEMLLTEAAQVANQLRVQTERLAVAIELFQTNAETIKADVAEAHRGNG